MYPWTFCIGHFVKRKFCREGRYVEGHCVDGHFVEGHFVEGRFVLVPHRLPSVFRQEVDYEGIQIAPEYLKNAKKFLGMPMRPGEVV